MGGPSPPKNVLLTISLHYILVWLRLSQGLVHLINSHLLHCSAFGLLLGYDPPSTQQQTIAFLKRPKIKFLFCVKPSPAFQGTWNNLEGPQSSTHSSLLRPLFVSYPKPESPQRVLSHFLCPMTSLRAQVLVEQHRQAFSPDSIAKILFIMWGFTDVKASVRTASLGTKRKDITRFRKKKLITFSRTRLCLLL